MLFVCIQTFQFSMNFDLKYQRNRKTFVRRDFDFVRTILSTVALLVWREMLDGLLAWSTLLIIPFLGLFLESDLKCCTPLAVHIDTA